MNELELIRVLAKNEKAPRGELYYCSVCDSWGSLAACSCAVSRVLRCFNGRGCDEGIPLDVICRRCGCELIHCHKWVFGYKENNDICTVCSKRFACWTSGDYLPDDGLVP